MYQEIKLIVASFRKKYLSQLWILVIHKVSFQLDKHLILYNSLSFFFFFFFIIEIMDHLSEAVNWGTEFLSSHWVQIDFLKDHL